MKKILISLLILSLICERVYGETYAITLTYEVSPTYIVSIPKTVDVTNNETSFEFSVSGDIYYGYQLEVAFNNSATITNGETNEIINVSQDKKLFNCDELDVGTNSKVYLNHQKLSSGTWNGKLNLTITLKEGA